MENKNNKVVYGIVNNIPSNYHSSDLRNFFSQFIETKGFNCFHFRHRPEKKISTNTLSLSKTDPNIIKTFCCVFRADPDHLDKLISCYNKKHWLDKKGDSLPSVCHISKICVSQDKEPEKQYIRRAEVKQIPVDREEFTEKDLSKLPELHPPDVMPNGNVGTPTCVFLELIQQCRLPPVIISKLGLTFPKTRTNRKYGDVPFDYGGDVSDLESSEEPVKSGKGHELLNEGEIFGETSTNVGTSSNLNQSQNKTDNDAELQHAGKQKEREKDKTNDQKWRKDPETQKRMNERIEEKLMGESDHSEGDDDSCEEWERHEALHDDPDNQERNDERLFENEIELKWEKGGSGLVFYTDAQYWKEEEGDFDEQTTDDWDVDMSVYYEKNGGDKDSRDFVSMRQSERWRDGTDKTDRYSLGFAKKRTKKNDKNIFNEPKIGKFDVHTKGIGRKLMEKQGWQEGKGIGASSGGISEALENEGQPPSIKTGLGYHGEKLSRNVAKPRTADRDVVIATIYDHPEDIQKKEPLLRRHDHYTIKYRDSVLFKKAEMKDS